MGLVLIAEDEEAMLDLFGDVVEQLGHRTMRAQNGEEALLLAQTERPDLVISDHMMPRRTGLQLLRALRSDRELASVPFVLVQAPGDVTPGHLIAEGDLRAAVAEVHAG